MIFLFNSVIFRFQVNFQGCKTTLGGVFKDFLIFIPTWGSDPISLIFFRWLKPPTSFLSVVFKDLFVMFCLFIFFDYIRTWGK